MLRFVYGLIDPDTREMRYVGATVVGMRRPRQHLRPSAYDGKAKHTHANRWIKSVIESGRKPEIVIIEYRDDSYVAETEWIDYFRSIGCRLTNETNGGQGRGGYKASEETRKKLSATRRNISDETRRKMSEAQKKRPPPSPETREKLRKATLGWSAEIRAKLSKSQRERRARERMKRDP